MSWRTTRALLLALLLIIQSLQSHDASSTESQKSNTNENDLKFVSSCLDPAGEPVDWWILLKVHGPSSKYVFYSSKDAEAGRTTGLKLSDAYRLDDPNTSAFLRTVYGSMGPRQDIPSEVDNRVFMAWNDQQPRPGNAVDGSEDDDAPPEDESMTQILKAAAASSMAQNKATKGKREEKTKTSKEGHSKDMYGHGERVESAHSKGMLGLAVVDSEGKLSKPDSYEDGKEYRVEGFFINHSFPRTPNAHFDESSPDQLVFRKQLPDQQNFFGSNIRNPQAKGQHAVCLSFTQNVSVSKLGEIQFNRSELDRAKMNLFALLDGLDTIGPSMVMTTYVPWKVQHRVWHQLFDVRSAFSEKVISPDEIIKNDNIARVKTRDSSSPPPNYSSHAFPIWPSKYRAEVASDGSISYAKRTSATSLRAPGQLGLGRCPKWSSTGDRDQYAGCFTSMILTTTSRQYQISPAIDFKGAMVIADVDDVIGARMVPSVDVERAKGTPFQGRPRYVSLMVVTQSWIDHGTFGSSSRYLVNTPSLKVVAWFHNNYVSHLPSEVEGVHAQPSSGTDHSKWFIASYPYGQKGNFIPLAGFMDLNRNSKATKLPNRNYGRGGMFIFFYDPLIVSFMMKLNPVVADSSARTLLDTTILSSSHLPQAVRMGTVVQFNQKGSGMAIKFEGDPVFRKFHIPYADVPAEVKKQLAKSLSINRGQSFLLGTDEPEITPFTPARMKSQPTGRKKEDFESEDLMESSFMVDIDDEDKPAPEDLDEDWQDITLPTTLFDQMDRLRIHSLPMNDADSEILAMTPSKSPIIANILIETPLESTPIFKRPFTSPLMQAPVTLESIERRLRRTHLDSPISLQMGSAIRPLVGTPAKGIKPAACSSFVMQSLAEAEADDLFDSDSESSNGRIQPMRPFKLFSDESESEDSVQPMDRDDSILTRAVLKPLDMNLPSASVQKLKLHPVLQAKTWIDENQPQKKPIGKAKRNKEDVPAQRSPIKTRSRAKTGKNITSEPSFQQTISEPSKSRDQSKNTQVRYVTSEAPSQQEKKRKFY